MSALWVVVPAYNEAVGIRSTLDALAAQTDLDFTLVVVDNDSRDGTGDVVRGFAAPFPVHVVLESSARGAGVAADTGFRYAIAHGAVLLARTDADCVPADDWVATARAALLAGAEMACGRSVPRRDEHPSLAERYAFPASVRLAALYGRYRKAHRDPRYRTPYVLCHGHNIALTASLYLRCGGTLRVPLRGEPEDVALLNRAREHSDRVIRVESMVVQASLRRLRAWGARRTLLWNWDRKYCPPDESVHIRADSSFKSAQPSALTHDVVGFWRVPGVCWQVRRAVAYRCCMRPFVGRRQRAAGTVENPANIVSHGTGFAGTPVTEPARRGETTCPQGSVSGARRRDRRVYLASHPVLFTLLALTRRRPSARLGRTVLVHGTEAVHSALTRLPLDRLGDGSTGAMARRYVPDGVLFDQEGAVHRGARRSIAGDLGSAGIDKLRPVWTDVLERGLAPLARGETVDLVELAADLAGATTCAMLDLDTNPRTLSRAAREAAAAAARAHLPGLHRPGTARAASRATAHLTALLVKANPAGHADSPAEREDDGLGLASMLAVAAVNTTVAALPRAVAWCADGRLWTEDEETLRILVDELLRVVAPSPLLPRVAGADGTVGGCPVRRGDRLMLVARHAALAHRDDPDVAHPAPPHVAQLVFGAGSHACPGAGLARAQLADTLRALAPYRPVVVRARADRRSALPSWRTLAIRSTR